MKNNDSFMEFLWNKFADVPLDENECLEKKWFFFKAGTHKEDIWHWFDKRHSKGVYYLLYELDK